jgi:hypothetical protein
MGAGREPQPLESGVGRTAGTPHARPALWDTQWYVERVLSSHFLCIRCPSMALQVSGSKLHIRHYELGALVLPSLEERYRRSPQFGFCASPHRPASGADLPPVTAITHPTATHGPAVLLLKPV